MNLSRFLEKTILYSFYGLFFLVPLIFTPWNFELFEFNKMVLVYLLASVITCSWLAKMILQRRILFKKTPFDIPLVLFLIFQIVSFWFSIDRHTSFFGYYSRFNGGLLSTISYVLLYYALASNFNKSKIIIAIRYMLVSAGLVAIYGILERLGIDSHVWVQDVKNRVFSTMGQPNWLAAYLSALLPIPLAFILSQKNKFNFKNPLFIAYSLLFITYSITIYFTHSRSGMIGAAFSLLIFGFLLLLKKYKSKKIYIFLFIFALLLSSAIFGYQKNAQEIRYIFGLSNESGIIPQQFQGTGSSSADIRKVVWRGAIQIFKAYPYFGSGVETYAYSYYNFRPVEHNILSEWDFLYNKAHNEYLNFLATTGALGLGSYLLLIGWITVWSLLRISSKHKEENNPNSLLLITLFSGWSSILISNFFGFSVVIIALFFFLFPAISYLLTIEENPETLPSNTHQSAIRHTPSAITPIQSISLIVLLIVNCYLLIVIGRYWYADKLFAQGIKMEKGQVYDLSYATLKEAISLNPGEPTFHDELAYNYAILATFAKKQNEPQMVGSFAENAFNESNKALSISPKNLNLIKNRAKIAIALTQIDTKYYEDARNSLEVAVSLAPTDAKITYNLGIVYNYLGQKEKAIEFVTRATKLKSNYIEAYFALVLLNNELNKKDEVVKNLKEVYRLSTGYAPALSLFKEYGIDQ